MTNSNITNLQNGLSNQMGSSMKTVLPKITVIGVGGGGCNAVDNMIEKGIQDVRFVAANSDLQSLVNSKADKIIQLGKQTTKGLGSGSRPEVGRAAAEEAIDEIMEEIKDTNMLFIAGGMGGGTGTGAAPYIAQMAREKGILTIAIVTTPFDFEGSIRKNIAEKSVKELEGIVDSLVVLPNQNLFEVITPNALMKDAFKVADGILVEGVKNITDLMIKKGLINLDFADIRSVMLGKGRAVIGTAIAEGENRAIIAAEAALVNRLLSSQTISGAKGVLVNISGSEDDLSLEEIMIAMNRIREDVGSEESNIIFGTSFEEELRGKIKISLVAAGFDKDFPIGNTPAPKNFTEKRSLETERTAFREGLEKEYKETNNSGYENQIRRETAKPGQSQNYFAQQVENHQVAHEPAAKNQYRSEVVAEQVDINSAGIVEDIIISEVARTSSEREQSTFKNDREITSQIEKEFEHLAHIEATDEDIAREILEENQGVSNENIYIEMEDDGEIDRIENHSNDMLDDEDSFDASEYDNEDGEVIFSDEEDEEMTESNSSKREEKESQKSNFFTSIFKKSSHKENEKEEEKVQTKIANRQFVKREVQEESVNMDEIFNSVDASHQRQKELKSDNLVFISKSMENDNKDGFNLLDVIEEMEENLDIPAMFRR